MLSLLSILMLSGAAAAADDAFRCELKEARGVPEPDASTAVQLLCGQIDRASTGRGAYDVTLATLGAVVVVTAARREPPASVSVQLRGLEELTTASGRIADALVHGLAFSATQRVDNLLVEETRLARAKKGSVNFSVGVADVESPGHGGRAAGFALGLAYATPRFALPAEMQVAWSTANGSEPVLDLFSISVGGRYFLSRRDVSPFVGGGLGALWLHASEGSYPWDEGSTHDYFDAERFGIAPYVEAGVEILRLHRGRIGLRIRADLPLAPLETQAYEAYPYWDGRGSPPAPVAVPAESRYVVPVTIGLTASF